MPPFKQGLLEHSSNSEAKRERVCNYIWKIKLRQEVFSNITTNILSVRFEMYSRYLPTYSRKVRIWLKPSGSVISYQPDIEKKAPYDCKAGHRVQKWITWCLISNYHTMMSWYRDIWTPWYLDTLINTWSFENRVSKKINSFKGQLTLLRTREGGWLPPP